MIDEPFWTALIEELSQNRYVEAWWWLDWITVEEACMAGPMTYIKEEPLGLRGPSHERVGTRPVASTMPSTAGRGGG